MMLINNKHIRLLYYIWRREEEEAKAYNWIRNKIKS